MAIFNSYVSLPEGKPIQWHFVSPCRSLRFGPWRRCWSVSLPGLPGCGKTLKKDHLISSTLRKLRGSSITRLDIVHIYICMYNTVYINIYILSEASESVLYVVTWHFAKAQAALVAAVKMTRICGIMPGASMGHDGTKWRRLSQPLSSIEMPLGWSENRGAPQF